MSRTSGMVLVFCGLWIAFVLVGPCSFFIYMPFTPHRCAL